MQKNKIMISFAMLSGLLLIVIVALPVASRLMPDHGLENGMLKPCGSADNCVCSEDYAGCNLDALRIGDEDAAVVWQRLSNAVVSTGGKIKKQQGKYLHATFTTPLMRFVDDFEARLDMDVGKIHLRSTSRIGRSDLGANRKRVNKILGSLRQAGPHAADIIN